MAFQVDFYTFEKNTNSTKKPTGASVPFQCELLGETSIVAPNIVLVVGGNPTVYNYAYIGEFSRYYFVKDWTWFNGRWSAKLIVDTLATWKDYIGRSTEYILRSASRSDGDIIDTMYPVKGGATIVTESGERLFTPNFKTGYFVVGIVNKGQTNTGTTSYYVMRYDQFDNFCNKLMSDFNWVGFNSTVYWNESTLKTQFNPIQYITSAMWYPFKPPVNGATITSVPLGWWVIEGVQSELISNVPIYTTNTVITIPKHPSSGSRGNYMNLSPYTKYLLDFRPWGQFELDTTKIIDSTYLFCSINVDCITGNGSLTVSPEVGASNKIMFVSETMVGVPVKMAQITTDKLAGISSAMQTTAGLIGGAASAVTGNVLGVVAGTGAVVSGIMSSAEAEVPQLVTNGTNGSMLGFLIPQSIVATFYDTVGEDNEHLGRPLCQKTKISNLSGYILCADAEIKLPATDMEINNVKQFMNGGFYYE